MPFLYYYPTSPTDPIGSQVAGTDQANVVGRLVATDTGARWKLEFKEL